MKFKKYQHVERFGTTEVEGIEFGECYIFPKIDGTNASVWLGEDNKIHAGSRNRELTLDNDNAGFFEWVLGQGNIINFLTHFPKLRLFGEWLVPHSLRTYKDESWRNFYVFDVIEVNIDEIGYLSYSEYKDKLDKYNINYIPPIAIINNPTYEQLIKKLPSNNYLIKDGEGAGEGIVIKRYDYVNKYGRVNWAKIVTSEFKEKHSKTMGAPKSEGKKMIEQEIAKEYTTKALCEKVFSKIENESGWSSRFIPRLLNTIYYDVVKEESWNFVKKYKNPVINYKTLQYFIFTEVKEHLNKLF